MSPSILATPSVYNWGDGCTAKAIVTQPEISWKWESMPSGTSEKMHYHQRATQYFHILSGTAVFRFTTRAPISVEAGQTILIPPGNIHQIHNQSAQSLTFFVLSLPNTNDDRIETS